jgi:mono/diheme cytochrome c family protein
MKKVLGVIFGASLIFVPATFAADIDRGRDLAERWCSSCHLVNAGQNRTTEAPPFATVASKSVDAQRLAYFLLSPHPVMPSMGLSRADATDLAAYIKSLESKTR